MKYWPICKNFMTPFVVSACITCQCGFSSKINSALTLWFASSNAFQNGLTWPGSTLEEIDSREKDCTYAGPVLTGGDWTLVLPTPKLAATSLLIPENFVQIGPSIQKLFMIFQNTDRPTHKQITPVPYTNTGEKYFIPIFSTSHKTERAHFSCSLHFILENLHLVTGFKPTAFRTWVSSHNH